MLNKALDSMVVALLAQIFAMVFLVSDGHRDEPMRGIIITGIVAVGMAIFNDYHARKSDSNV